MKKRVSLFTILIFCLGLLGCKDESMLRESSATDSQLLNLEEKDSSYVSQDIISKINKLIEYKEEAVAEKDIDKYMTTVNKADKEYYAEQKHWFQDILVNRIDNYKLNILNIKKKAEDTYLVKLKQQYTYQNKSHSLEYEAIYKISENGMVDCDLDFRTKETEHFIIKFTEGSRDVSDKFAKAAEEAYEIVKFNYGKVPEDKTVIKIYEDMDRLKQFVKLSFQWDMAGWYEYGEAIKFIGISIEANPQSLAHELIHKVTIKETNNNMPYWLAEGLATHFSGNQISKSPARVKMSIIEMQNTDLEKLTAMKDILSYYESAQEAVEFIINTYGRETLDAIILELSKYPFEDKTGSEVHRKNSEIFNFVAEKVLNKNTYELDLEFISEK